MANDESVADVPEASRAPEVILNPALLGAIGVCIALPDDIKMSSRAMLSRDKSLEKEFSLALLAVTLGELLPVSASASDP